MKIIPIDPNKRNPHIIRLSRHKRARDYIWGAMQTLSLSFRDIAEVCGYYGDEQFGVFFRRLTKGHRLSVESPAFANLKSCIDNQLRRKVRDEVAQQQLEVAQRKEDSNRNSSSNCK